MNKTDLKKEKLKDALKIVEANQKLENKYWNTKKTWSRNEILELLRQEGVVW